MTNGLVLLHGKPGSGKSSCASEAIQNTISPRYNHLEHFSIGSHLRAIASGDIKSEFERQVKKQTEALSEHKPIDNDVVRSVVSEYMGKTASGSLIVIDGYPKYISQVRGFEEDAEKNDSAILGIMHVEIADNIAVERILARGTREGELSVSVELAKERLLEHASGAHMTTQYMATRYPIKNIDGTLPMHGVISLMRDTLQLF